MSYIRKTKDRWDVETDYGHGWEVESSEYTRKEAVICFKEYCDNLMAYGKCAVRMVKRRERICDVETA